MPSPSSTSSQGGGTLQRNQPIRVAQRPSFSKEGLLAGGGASGGQTNGIDLQRHMRQTSSTSANRFVVNNNDEKPTLNGGYPRRLPSSQSSHSMTTFPVSRPSERGSGGGGTLPPAYSYNHSRHQNSTASAYSTGHLGSSTAVKMQQQQNPTTSNYNNCTNGPAGSSKQYSSLNPAAGNSLSEAESVPARQQRLSQIGYSDILELARNQQKQIEANYSQLDERRRIIASLGGSKTASGSSTNVDQKKTKIQISSLRAQIARDEQELAHLSSLQCNTRQLSSHNHFQNQELKQLEETYTRDDDLLRKAVVKVDYLQKQLNQLHLRRAKAASAAASIAQIQKINSGQIKSEKDSKTMMPMNGTMASHPTKFSHVPAPSQPRPKASVEPFHVQHQQKNYPMTKNGENYVANSSCLHSQPLYDQCDKFGGRCYDRPYQAVNDGRLTNQQLNGHNNRLQLAPTISKTAEDANQDGHVRLRSSMYEKPVTRIQADQMSLRNSITSIKRRSWMMENNENIWRFLTEEQRKGRNHISFDDVETAKKSANFIQPASPSVLQNGEKEVPVEVKGEATSSPENSESPSVSDNRKIFKPSSEEDQLDVPTLPKRLDEPPIKEESKVIKIEVDSSPPAEQIHTSKTTSAAASESEKEFKPSYPPTPPKELQSPRGRPENYDLFNKEFSMAPTATFEDLEPSVCSSSDEEEEESCPSSKKHLQIFRTVSLDEDQKLDDNLENLKRESKHDSSWADENKPSEEIKNDEELLTEATITNNGVLIEPNKSRFEQSDSYFISDNLLASLEEPHQFLTFGGLGPIEISTSGGQIVTDETSGASTDDIQIDEVSFQPVPGLKGILSKGEKTPQQKHVVFDRIVLFHDMAYEGQYDELLELASEIENISVANSEGLTALHYAICAGHHDIVKFLIENDAQVNALDLDGWSPLHCAASCNNLGKTLTQLKYDLVDNCREKNVKTKILVMLKQLVENGACPFATTVSKSEIASDLFEETQDCAMSMEYMELVEEALGVVNQRRVYAAYYYEAGRDDELSLEEGEELRVIRRNEWPDDEAIEHPDEGFEWWLCERTDHRQEARTINGKQKGLVPRNYLSLFPVRKFQNEYKTIIELPHSIENAISKMESKQKDTSTTDENHDVPVEVELSTYA